LSPHNSSPPDSADTDFAAELPVDQRKPLLQELDVRLNILFDRGNSNTGSAAFLGDHLTDFPAPFTELFQFLNLIFGHGGAFGLNKFRKLSQKSGLLSLLQT